MSLEALGPLTLKGFSLPLSVFSLLSLIVVFDPATVQDRATYKRPNQMSVGIFFFRIKPRNT